MKRRSRIKLATTAAIGSLALAGIGLSTGGAAGQSPGGVEFTDWTAVDANVATGTILGHSISLSGSNVVAPPASVVDGTSTVFNQPLFTPQLATSDVLYFGGLSGYSYTLAFGAPTRDPVLHVANLASTLGFPAGTSITKLSGEDSFTVSGSSVVGALAGSSDASGSVRLNGVFESISFSATPVYAAPTEDGIYLHVGASPEPPTLPPTAAGPGERDSANDPQCRGGQLLVRPGRVAKCHGALHVQVGARRPRDPAAGSPRPRCSLPPQGSMATPFTAR